MAVVALAASAVLMVFPESRALLQGWGAQFFGPAQQAITRSTVGVGEAVGVVTRAGQLAAQNRNYREEIDRLRSLDVQVKRLETENEDLRQLLEMRRRSSIGNLVSAQVIARDPLALIQALVIDRGTNDGLVANMPVITYQGVAGRVIEVSPTTAKVLLVADVNSAVSVDVDGADSHTSGVVRGTGDGRLLLQYVPREDALHLGDPVTTSGIGGIFPPGLLVGTVDQVRSADVGVFQEALVQPAVRLKDMERIYVVLTRQ
jgi:rod shape-determining protein MreC